MLFKMMLPALLAPTLACANVVVMDGFDDAGRSNGVDPQDLAWFTSTNSAPLAVVSDSTLDPISATHNVLRFNNSSGGMVFATLSQTINVTTDTSLRLSITYRDVGMTGIRIGLFSSNGTAAPTSDAFSGANPLDNDSGFYVNIGQTNAQIMVDRGTSAGVFYGDRNTGPSTSYSSLGSDVHQFVLTLTLDAGGNTLATATLDNANGVSMTWTGTSFDEIIMSQINAPSVDFRIDNVTVETLPVPEPSSLCLLGVGVMTILKKGLSRHKK